MTASTLRTLLRTGLMAAGAILLAGRGLAQEGIDLGGQLSVSPKVFAGQVEKDLTELRGLPFKKPIEVQNQSLEDFEKYVDREIGKQVAAEKLKNLSKIVRTVGLYRGPEFDYMETTKLLLSSQVAAYYDPGVSTFFVLMNDMPEVVMGGLYAHELYHGLQDQYFGLEAYYGLGEGGTSFDDDQLLARQSVVEGEAMFVMQLWTMKQIMGSVPDPATMDMMMQQMEGMLDPGSLRALIRNNAVSSALGDSKDMARALEAVNEVPGFMIETLLGAYIRGMIFVASIQKDGWPEVEKLYAQPPVSSEMILYPEKWRAGEKPYRISLAGAMKDSPALEGWKLLDENTLGEIQMGLVFSEYEMPDIGKIASAGWDGDRYAVLENPANGSAMLLMATAWDTEAEAVEFAGAYRTLAEAKDKESGRATRLMQEGRDVWVVEAPAEAPFDALFGLLRSAKKEK